MVSLGCCDVGKSPRLTEPDTSCVLTHLTDDRVSVSIAESPYQARIDDTLGRTIAPSFGLRLLFSGSAPRSGTSSTWQIVCL